MRNTAALFSAVMFVSGCESLPEDRMVHSQSPARYLIEDQHTIDSTRVVYSSSGPIDWEAAMRGFNAPKGAGGFLWGAAAELFHNLVAPLPVTANSYWTSGKVVDFACTDLAECVRYPVKQIVEGRGTHMMAEYYNSQYSITIWSSVTAPNGTKTRDVLLTLHTGLWMMCGSRDPSTNITHYLSLCGLRLFFDTETPEQALVRSKDPAWVSRYHHMLVSLVRQHGAPPGYERCFRVTITTPNEVVHDERYRKRCALLRTWSWCPRRGRELSPDCPATVTLAYDSRFKTGVVIYATEAVWKFAFAQWESGGDPTLWQMLNEENLSPLDEKTGKWGRGACTRSMWGCPSFVPLTQSEIDMYRIPAPTGAGEHNRKDDQAHD